MEDVHKVSVDNLVKEVCSKESIINPKCKYFTDGPQSGFMGNIAKLEITGEDEKKLHVIVKYASLDDVFRENLNIRRVFVQEISFYMDVWPLLSTLQERYGAKLPVDITCKCFGYDDTLKCELMLLENLIDDGYNILNSLVPMNVAHVEFVLKAYAKFHAISLAYKNHDFDGYKKLINRVKNLNSMNSGTAAMEIFANALNTLKDNLNSDDALYEAYSTVCNSLHDIHYTVTTVDEHAVIYHGDSWCNNFLFKYENQSSKPTSVKFVDFQIMGPGSVALDVSYFLMVNSSPEMIKNTDYYLKVYYDSLAGHLRDLDCDPDVIFPYSIFLEQWKKYSLYGLFMSITVLKFALAGADERPDLAKDFTNAVNYVGTHANEYQRRTEAIINYYYEAGII